MTRTNDEAKDVATALRLDYRSPRAKRARGNPNVALYVALTCGSLPALAGTLLIVLWLATYSQSLPVFGMIVIFVGLILFELIEISVRTMNPGWSDDQVRKGVARRVAGDDD